MPATAVNHLLVHVFAFCISKGMFITITIAMKGKSKERK